MNETFAFLKKAQLRSEIRACLALALPLAAAQLAQQATSFVDTVMMGLLGSEAIAAGGLGGISFGTLLLVCSGSLSATSPLVSEAYGRGDRRRIEQVAQQGFWLALLIALPATLLLWNAGAILTHLGQQESTIALVVNYLRAIAPGLFPALAFAVMRNVVSALSRPRPVMVITLCGLVFNVVANYSLMFGKIRLGAISLPPLGLTGIGLASTMSFWGVLIALLIYIRLQSDLRQHRIFPPRPKFDRQILKELLQIGIPIGVLYGVETGLFTITAFLMGFLGTVPLAAHQIALQTAAITFMVPAGISYATTVRVGQLLGQENLPQARLAAFINLAIGATFMAIMGIAFLVFPRSIVALYLDVNNLANAAVVAMAIDLLRVAAMFQLVDGIQVIAAGALRGLQDTRTPMLIGLFAYWGIGLSCGYTLGLRSGWGGVGLWIGLAIGLAVASIIFTWRFTRLINARIRLSA
ncbi:MATE family efflux transporter [Microcoleus sp. FACHB-1515]|uniref:MATE family efflux transporter n=1 Tax=Cyanophyceae TaxID=3028117 RepID=UPI001685614B|nr:MATE family efflux transporter [Microcoleus sp. FACHB-1515]MBD2092830.1 MATE family efflux transporter [Microcoleus sp. FACHB-1515]